MKLATPSNPYPIGYPMHMLCLPNYITVLSLWYLPNWSENWAPPNAMQTIIFLIEKVVLGYYYGITPFSGNHFFQTIILSGANPIFKPLGVC
jgi:hypothetical protein